MRNYAICLFLVTAAVSLFALDDSDLFYQAERKFEAGDYSSAIIDYEELIRQYPLSSYLTDAQYRRAVSLFRLGRTEESLKLFLRIRERYADGTLTGTLSFWLGINYYVLKDYEAAEKELSDYLEKQPNGEFRKNALLTLAFAQYKNNRGEAALETAFRLSDSELNIEDEPEALAVIFSLFLKFEEYEKLVRFSQTYSPEGLPARYRDELTYYRAEAFFRLKEYEKAEADYLRCLNASSGEIAAGSAQRLFSLYRIQRKYDELNKLMRTAEDRFAEKPEVINALRLKYGVEKYKLKRYDEAIISLNRIWTGEPLSVMDDLVPLYLAQSFAAKGEPGRAFDVLDRYRGEIKEHKIPLLFLAVRYGAETAQWAAVERDAAAFLATDAGIEEKESVACLQVLSLIEQKKFDEARKAATERESELPNLAVQQRFVRLKLRIAEQTGDLDYSVRSLDRYLGNASEDDQAVLTYIGQNFRAKDFGKIIDYSSELRKKRPGLAEENPVLEVFVRYMRALSFVSLKQYGEALREFEKISPEDLLRNGWNDLVPYYFYYYGWACYRTTAYDKALDRFSAYLRENPEGEFRLKSLYLCGWCCYSLEEYVKAAEWFLRYAEEETGASRLNAALTAGKAYAAAGVNDKAESVLTAVASSAPRRLRTEALYEYALLMRKTGFADKSADLFLLIFKEDPKAEEAPGALLTAAEIYRERGKTDQAILAYTDFAVSYPDSPQLVQSLAAQAELLFDAGRYSESASVLARWGNADTANRYEMRRLVLRARLAMKTKAWDEAASAWNELLYRFPEEGRRLNASLELAKLSYLKLGQSDREAELSLAFARSGGLDSEEGRSAAVDLAGIYFADKANRAAEAANSTVLLNELIRKYPQDTKNSARARFRLGQKAYDEQKYAEALSLFVDAVAGDGTAAFVPEALFKAGMSARAEGQTGDADALFSRLRTHFPQSEWTRRIPAQRRRS
ncbi:MAG: tetratricopeptide repeat protein [Spirochaetia bacterium]|nr:tetratricopeptide repeat protein [Spirochaetia bacterium]